MKISKRSRLGSVASTPEKETPVVQSTLVTMLEHSPVASELAAVMEAWALLGNRWLNSLEATLELNNLGKEIPAPNKRNEIDLHALTSLTYMGYMTRSEATFQNGYCVSYRLSDSGKKAVKLDDTQTPGTRTRKPKIQQLTIADITDENECSACGGSGVEANGDICETCYGTGEAQAKKPVKMSAKDQYEHLVSVKPKPKVRLNTVRRK